MKHFRLHAILVTLAILAVLTVAAFGCAPTKPAAPTAPSAPTTPAAPAAPAAPAVPSTTPPPAPQAKPPAGGPLPSVNYFVTSSDSVAPKSIIILIWSVSGADLVSIDNGMGKVESKGRYALIPAASTTFVLTATNAAGSVTAQTAVKVEGSEDISGYRPGYTIPHVGQAAIIGSPFTIDFEASPSQGLQWVVDYYDQTTLLLVSSEYKAYGPPPRGYDGKQTFTFKPLKTEDTRILFSNVNDKKPTEFDSIIYDIHIKIY